MNRNDDYELTLMLMLMWVGKLGNPTKVVYSDKYSTVDALGL